MSTRPVVVKIGGSLFDLPDLGPRLTAWLQHLDMRTVLLVPGGGPTADVVRAFDRVHGLGEEAAHWLALEALGLNAHFLAALLAPVRAVVVDGPEAALARWAAGDVPVVDAYRFARQDEGRPGSLPHTWSVTSDSVAARIATLAGARRLVLLKSALIPEGISWTEAGRNGLVDDYFDRAIAAAGALEVRAVNLRAGPPDRPGGAP